MRIFCLLFALLNTAWAQPNIIFILTDDMSWTGTSVQLDPTVADSKSDFYLTPNIERLAAQGMVFSAAYAPGPMCTPSRAALLTGKTPAELRMTTPGGGRAMDYHKLLSANFIRDLPSSETTVAEALQEVGYATAHFGKWHLGSSAPGGHGFDVHDGNTNNEGAGTQSESNPKDIFGITQRAIAFIEEQVQEQKPFYVQLSHYAVHTPIEALEGSKTQFAQMPSGSRHDGVDYAAMTWDLDMSVGRLLKRIAQLDLIDNTYIVLMSDNGAPSNPRQSFNRPLSGGKGSLYEGGIRVPLIVRGPDVIKGTFCTEPVSGCDLFPTFCEWAQVSLDDRAGSSLVPLLKLDRLAFKRTQAALLFHYPHYGQGPQQRPQSALIVGQYKLIKNWEDGSLELFNLKTDLEETDNLVMQLPEIAADLNAQLNERLAQVMAALPKTNPDYDPKSGWPRRRGRELMAR
ncbi:sulfatase [Coraliomargarita sp. SDUM461004]|uniref:Sulfatase n=1 Tax=Thalassobacterium sedimentorum TaxID=3041258 RepID=A0ABU1AJM2_9BACT|nr:sulfatase [Coraliomargarita sp. SDUM461004]MDQ8193808.1 sulfatase [Coraliomargarita sp. SDUM461004]